VKTKGKKFEIFY